MEDIEMRNRGDQALNGLYMFDSVCSIKIRSGKRNIFLKPYFLNKKIDFPDF